MTPAVAAAPSGAVLPRWQKVGLLSALYFVQGLPYGFQSSALPNYLRASGVSLTKIGLLGALAMPWAFKALWASFVDRHGSLTFGRRKSWIVPLQGLMGVCSLLAAFFPPSGALTPLLVLIFLLNLFAATQDIAVDGLAVSMLDADELGLGNAIQVVGYKAGMLVGGGVLIALSSFFGWKGVFVTMAALCWAVMAYTFFFEERRFVEQPEQAPSMREIGARIWKALKLPGTGWLLVFVATYKIGEVMADKMFGPFLIDHGVTTETIGLWVGTWGMIASLLGSLAGGWVATRWPLVTAVGITAAFRVIPLVLQWALTAGLLPVEATVVVPIVSSEHFFAGALTTAMFALMMSRVDRTIGSTHYTLLASIEVIGKTPGGLLSGWLADAAHHVSTDGAVIANYALVHAVAAGSSIAFLLLLIPMQRTERRRVALPVESGR